MMRGKTAGSFAMVVLLSATLFGQITKDEADERLDTAIGLFRMTSAVETKLIRWFEVDQDNPNAVGVKADLCGNWPKVKKTIDDIPDLEIELKKDKSLAVDPGLSKKLAELLPFRQQVISKKRQLDAMGLACPENSEVPTKSNDLGEQKVISVSPDFRIAAKRAFHALLDLEFYSRFHSWQEDHFEHAEDASRALEEVDVQTSLKSADSYLAESYVHTLLSSYLGELNLIQMARLSKMGQELGHNPLPIKRQSSPERIAACKSEIPAAVDAGLTAKEWAQRKEASKCFTKADVTAQPAEKPITVEDLDSAVDKAMRITKMAVTTEDKLMTLYNVNRDGQEAKALQAELCGNLDAMNQANQDVQRIDKYIFSRDFEPVLMTYPDGTSARLDDRLKALAKLENVFSSKGWQLKSMGWACPGVAADAEKPGVK
jgi:hypothetical protein